MENFIFCAVLLKNEHVIEIINTWVPGLTLREKCPYLELFWFAFSRIRTEYEEIRSISPSSVWIWGNADQNNSK